MTGDQRTTEGSSGAGRWSDPSDLSPVLAAPRHRGRDRPHRAAGPRRHGRCGGFGAAGHLRALRDGRSSGRVRRCRPEQDPRPWSRLVPGPLIAAAILPLAAGSDEGADGVAEQAQHVGALAPDEIADLAADPGERGSVISLAEDPGLLRRELLLGQHALGLQLAELPQLGEVWPPPCRRRAARACWYTGAVPLLVGLLLRAACCSCPAHRFACRRDTRFDTAVAVPAITAVRATPRSKSGMCFLSAAVAG